MGDISRTDVFSAFKKPTGQGGNGVGMCLDKIRHDLGELYFILEVGDSALLVWEEGGEGVDVVAVDLSNMWIGYNNERKVPQSLNPMGESDGK